MSGAFPEPWLWLWAVASEKQRWRPGARLCRPLWLMCFTALLQCSVLVLTPDLRVLGDVGLIFQKNTVSVSV